MPKKAIVFDVDGVITDSGTRKDEIIEEVLDSHGLLHLPQTRGILNAGLNRIIILEKLSEFADFDFNIVLNDINAGLRTLESETVFIEQTQEFIKKYSEEYLFFTNTSMPKPKLISIFERDNFSPYFMELLAYEDGSKKENIEYIMEVYKLPAENILFIDDKDCHIEAVKTTGVHTLLFDNKKVSLGQEIKHIF